MPPPTLLSDLHGRNRVVVQFPVLTELEYAILEPLGAVRDLLERFTWNVRGLCGEAIGNTEPALEGAPTLEQIGALAVFANYLDAEIENLTTHHDALLKCVPGLDDLRINGRTSYWRAAA